MTKDTFSADDWMAEIDKQVNKQVDSKRHHLCFSPGPEQAYYIVKARDSGVDWDTIMQYCKSRGWAGSESTLLKFYRQQKGK